MPTISGIVKDSTGAFAQRLVRAYRRDTGFFIGQAVSNATTGAYSITTAYAGEHFVVMHDGTATGGDPYWDQTTLACHFDGTNGSTTFTDEKGHILSVFGNAIISTAQSKFGGSSAYFDGSGDTISTDSSADFGFGTGDFTIEFWLYYLGGNGYVCFLKVEGSGNYLYYGLQSGTKRPFIWNNGDVIVSPSDITNSTWQHHAITRESGTVKLWLNGTLLASTAWSVDLGGSKSIIVGGESVTPAQPTYGYIDDLRITKGVARYTANFTPPSSEFLGGLVVSGGTQNLLAFDRVTPV